MKRRIIKRTLSAALALALLLTWMPTMVFAAAGDTVTAFDSLAETSKEVDNGTSLQKLSLPATVGATVQGPITETSLGFTDLGKISFKCTPEFVVGSDGMYTLTPVPPEGFTFVKAPPTYIVVMGTVAGAPQGPYGSNGEIVYPLPVFDELTNADTTFDRLVRILLVEYLSLMMMNDLPVSIAPTPKSEHKNISVTWVSSPGYNPNAADTYTFTAKPTEPYATATGVYWPTITVTVKAPEHTISYDYVGEPDDATPTTDLTPKSAPKGDTVTLPTHEVMGYTLYWDVKTTGGDTVDVADNATFTMPDSAVIATGTWKVNYTVMYNTESASMGGGSTVYHVGDTVKVSASAEEINVAGREFKGWSLDRVSIPAKEEDVDYKDKETFELTQQFIDDNLNGGTVINLYPVFVNKTFDVTYTFAGEDPKPTPPAGDSYKYEESVMLAPQHKAAGYTFEDWVIDGEDTTVDAEREFKMPARNVNISAEWDYIDYTVQFTMANGSTVTPNDTYHIGDDVPISATTATTTPADGYDLAGWSFTEGKSTFGNGDYKTEDTLSIDAELITARLSGDDTVFKLYPVFVKSVYKITYERKFINADGTVIAGPDGLVDPGTAHASYGDRVKLTPSVESINGYTFKEWTVEGATAEEGTNGKFFTMPAGNVTVTETWVLNRHKIEYDHRFPPTLPSFGPAPLNGVSEADYGYSVTLTPPSNIPAGYGFSHWSVAKTGNPDTPVTVFSANNFAMPDYDVTVTCVWVAEDNMPYHVSFLLLGTDIAIRTGFTTEKGFIGQSITLNARKIDGYTVVAGYETVTKTLTAKPEENEFTFYYDIAEANLPTITVTPKSGEWVYDGKPHSAPDFTADADGTPFPENPQYKVEVPDTNVYPTITNAGKVAYKLGIDDVVIKYTIGESTVDVTDYLYANDKLIFKDGTLTVTKREATMTAQDYEMVVGSGDPTEYFTAKPETESGNRGFLATDVPDAGTYELVLVGKPEQIGTYTDVIDFSNKTYDNDNYNVTWVKGDLTITADETAFADVKFTVTGASASFPYDGLPHSIAAGKYTVNNDEALPTGFTVTATADGATATNVLDSGENTVHDVVVLFNGVDVTPWFTTNGRVTFVHGKITITPLAITLTGLTDEYTFDVGEIPNVGDNMGATPSSEFKANQMAALQYSVAWQTEGGETIGKPLLPGTYKTVVTVNNGDNPNYTIKTEDGTVTIKENNSLVVNFPGKTVIYNGREQSLAAPTVTGAAQDKIEYSIDDGATYNENMPTFTDVGEHTVLVRVSKTGYVTKVEKAVLEITPLAVTVTGKDAVYPLGQVEPATATFASSVEGITLSQAMLEDLAPQYSVSYQRDGTTFAASAITETGEYVVKTDVVTIPDSNYTIKPIDGTLTVWSVGLAGKEVPYNSLVQTLDEVDPVGLPEGIESTVEYQIVETDGTEPVWSDDGWSTEMPGATNAGDYAVGVRVTTDDCGTATDWATLTINPLEVFVTGNNAVYPLDVYPLGADAPPLASATPTTDSDVIITDGMRADLAENYYAVAYRNDGGEVAPSDIAVGEYEVAVRALNGYIPEGARMANYTVEVESGSLTIWDVTLASAATTYNGAAQRLATAQTPYLPEGATIEYSTGGGAWGADMPAFTNAGVYTVQVRVDGEELGYGVKTVEATLTINRFAVTLTGNGGYFDYDSPDIPRSAYATLSTATPTPLTYSSAYYLPDGTFAYYATQGTYSSFPYLTGDSVGNPNYNVTIVRGTLVIGAAPPEEPPVVPVVPVVPVAPVAPVPPAEPVEEDEPPLAGPDNAGGTGTDVTTETPAGETDGGAADGTQGADGTETIGEDPTAIAGPNGGASWALLNLFLAILALVLGAAMLLALLGCEDRRAGLGFRILTAVMGAAAVVMFFLTNSIGGSMIFANMWTILMAVILAVQVLCMLLVRMARARADER